MDAFNWSVNALNALISSSLYDINSSYPPSTSILDIPYSATPLTINPAMVAIAKGGNAPTPPKAPLNVPTPVYPTEPNTPLPAPPNKLETPFTTLPFTNWSIIKSIPLVIAPFTKSAPVLIAVIISLSPSAKLVGIAPHMSIALSFKVIFLRPSSTVKPVSVCLPCLAS